MFIIYAIIRPKKWIAVQEALRQIEVERMTVADVLGFAEPVSAGTRQIPLKLTQYVLVEIIVNDDFQKRTVEMIEKVARTGVEGMDGDGKVFVLPICDTIRIHDNFRGKGAV
ncbi:MAG: P-II family nitrogen regulator [Thermoguttaceae bacterium]